MLIRDAAYRRLLKTTRAELHERVAAWTDRTAATLLGEHEVTVAHHYEQAHRYLLELGTVDDHAVTLGRRAAGLLTTAAHHALERDDLAAAGGSSVRALALLPTADRDERAELLMMACECLLAAGDGAGARPLVEELGALGGDDARLGAWAVCFTAQLISLTDPDGLLEADEPGAGRRRHPRRPGRPVRRRPRPTRSGPSCSPAWVGWATPRRSSTVPWPPPGAPTTAGG